MREGDKVVLLGGGGPRNTFHVVRFLGMKNDSQAILETNDSLPNPFEPFVTAEVQGLPLGGSSWSLAELHPDLKDLPLGHYAMNGNEIVDISHIGLFGSILRGKVVKTL